MEDRVVRKVLLQMGLSVDGIVAGGPQGASQAGAPDEDEAVRRWKVESLHQVGAHIMGRVTYEQMAAPLLKDLLAPLPLRLVDSKTFTDGTAISVYEAIRNRLRCDIGHTVRHGQGARGAET